MPLQAGDLFAESNLGRLRWLPLLNLLTNAGAIVLPHHGTNRAQRRHNRGRIEIEKIDSSLNLNAGLAIMNRFAGTLLGLPVDADRRQVETVVRQSAFVAYTPQARRRVRPLLQRMETPNAEMVPTLAPASLARIRDALAG